MNSKRTYHGLDIFSLIKTAKACFYPNFPQFSVNPGLRRKQVLPFLKTIKGSFHSWISKDFNWYPRRQFEVISVNNPMVPDCKRLKIEACYSRKYELKFRRNHPAEVVDLQIDRGMGAERLYSITS